MAVEASFQPRYGSGQTVTPAAAAASIDIDASAKTVCLTNTGANICYIRIGRGSISATTADYPVVAGQQVAVSKGDGDNVLSHISAVGTTLHVITGEGF